MLKRPIEAESKEERGVVAEGAADEYWFCLQIGPILGNQGSVEILRWEDEGKRVKTQIVAEDTWKSSPDEQELAKGIKGERKKDHGFGEGSAEEYLQQSAIKLG